MSLSKRYNFDKENSTACTFNVSEEAERVMVEERERIALPHGMPTFELVEQKRIAAKSK